LFFNLSYQTYVSYMNAMTQTLLTTYPVGSLSEAQLLKYADFYTDSCLHPMILHDESIFREEAWRYRLESLDDPLTIEGTVYSEMLGALDLSFSSYMNSLRTAYPGSTVGNQHGGDPQYIPDMTFESLCAYHEQYYHPSHCVGYLYGSFDDYTAFLALLDEAFSPYEKREFSFEDPDYEPLTESKEVTFSYPVEAGSDTANGTAVYYSFLCPGLKEDAEEETLMNTLTDLLTADASPLIQRLKAVLPYGDFSCSIEIDAPDDSIVFLGMNLNPEDAETFRDTVDAVLAELVKGGFSDELVDSVNANLMMNLRLTPEQSGYGVNVIDSLATYHAASGQPFSFLDYVDALEEIGEWHHSGAYQKAIAKWLGSDAVTVLAVTNSEPGLREQLDAAEAERLEKVKASMTDEELQALVDSTLAEQEEDDASLYVAQLQAETAATLPEEIREFDYTDETARPFSDVKAWHTTEASAPYPIENKAVNNNKETVINFNIMKKSIYYVVMAAACLLIGATACSDGDTPVEVPDFPDVPGSASGPSEDVRFEEPVFVSDGIRTDVRNAMQNYLTNITGLDEAKAAVVT
ncbi:MAG: insulinase family protein, partial [Oscillospiraceae bacterium]|nr:insulinase family protein [Oscillospiraceae bacterium]